MHKETKYHWMSNATGEIVGRFVGVIKAVIVNYCCYHFKDLNWSYSKEGF